MILNIADCTTLFKFNYTNTTSTNEIVLELLEFVDAVIVTADFQTKGRGRNGKDWYGNKKENLYYSFGIRHKMVDFSLYLLQIIGCLAIYNVLTATYGNLFVLKYPNDIYGIVGRKNKKTAKKISGIVSETNILDINRCNSVIGIGVNVLQTNFTDLIRNDITSLKLMGIDATYLDIIKIQNKLTNEIIKLFSLSEIEVFNVWRSKLDIINKTIKVVKDIDSDISYRVKDILSDGRLMLISSKREERIIDNGDSIRYELL